VCCNPPKSNHKQTKLIYLNYSEKNQQVRVFAGKMV
jgi:hypothetical protein